jgi:hypothetical protein
MFKDVFERKDSSTWKRRPAPEGHEARGIADVLRLCDEIVRADQFGDDGPVVFDPSRCKTCSTRWTATATCSAPGSTAP